MGCLPLAKRKIKKLDGPDVHLGGAYDTKYMIQTCTTWASLDKLADRCLLQIRTGCSSILCFSHDLPASRLLGSHPATQTAFAPCLPIANFTVNWNWNIGSG